MASRIIKCDSCGRVKRADGKPCACGSKGFFAPTRDDLALFRAATKTTERAKVERVRERKDAEALARERVGIVRSLRAAVEMPRRCAEELRADRFAAAEAWVCGSDHPGSEVTQVGEDGFFWRPANCIVPTFMSWIECWAEEAR